MAASVGAEAGAAELVEVLESLSDGFYALDAAWRFTYVNRESERIWKRPRADLLGRALLACFPAVAGTEAHAILSDAMRNRRTARGEVISPVVGEWAEVHAHPKADGGISVFFSVITERKRAEQRLRDREAELARVQRIGGIAGVEVFLQSGFRNRRSPEYLRLHGLPPEAENEPHEAWVARIHPDDRERADQAFRDAVAAGKTEYQAEYRIIRPSDGALRWISAKAEIERDADGRPLRLFGAHIDVTDRKEGEAEREKLLAELRAERATQTLLIHELNHRVKNTLATVQSVVVQTLRNATDSGTARRTIEARLIALSRAHDTLTRQNWQGADLGEVVAQAIEQNAAQDRCRAAGPAVALSPRQSLALAMALHELFTNARKYGALSGPGGRVVLDWQYLAEAQPRKVRLTWREQGGPPVEPPAQRGFGTRLLERGLGSDLGGSVALAFEPAGVRCVIEAPVAG